MKKVLNVGGNSKAIPLPSHFADFEHLLLDIDPKGAPDVLMDARKLVELDANQFDAIYCSHNLEHYYNHDVRKVLSGFLHILTDDGFAHIRVPDLNELMRSVVEKGLDVEDVLYESPAGPIKVLDVLYGYGKQIEQSGEHFFAHKTGFTPKSLAEAVKLAGFHISYSWAGNLEINILAFKNAPSAWAMETFKLP